MKKECEDRMKCVDEMTYKEARAYIEETKQFGSVLGLKSMKKLLKELDHPERELKVIHIAGTNGKGSTSSYIASILQNAGYCTGMYNSPSLFRYREMIKVNDKMISKDVAAALLTQIREAVIRIEAVSDIHPTVFEIETALAFLYFQACNCDIVVLETGLGGRDDATNVVDNPVCSVFTMIGMDHMAFLGDSLEEIAQIKAGIIKAGSPVISIWQNPKTEFILRSEAAAKNSPFFAADRQFLQDVIYGAEEQIFSYGGYDNLCIHLAGSFQIENAVLAVETIKVLKQEGWYITEKHIRKGLKETSWAGRFTLIGHRPLCVMDGAHNPDGIRKLKDSLRIYFPGKRMIFIMGVFCDKDYDAMAGDIVSDAAIVITVKPPGERGLPAQVLAKAVKKYQSKVKASDSVADAVETAFSLADSEDIIVAFGSLSFLKKFKKAAEACSKTLKRAHRILDNDEFQKRIQQINHLEKPRIYCKHGLEHLLSVARIGYILNLERKYHLEKDFIYAAALLHDIGKGIQYEKGIPHDLGSVRIAENILKDCGYNADEISMVSEAIKNHRKLMQKEAKTAGDKLSELLYDADKLSRECFLCSVYKKCDWKQTKKNSELVY